MVDKGDRFEILVNLPGAKKEDIEVSVEGNRVSISTNVKEEKEAKEGEPVLHSERSFASVTDVGAEAHHESGVLKLTLPKRASATTKRLPVH